MSTWCAISSMQKLGERDFNREGLRIYTSLDPDLQRVAPHAVDATHPTDRRAGGQAARATPRKLRRTRIDIYPRWRYALNPHTGQVLALVGGRNYGTAR